MIDGLRPSIVVSVLAASLTLMAVILLGLAAMSVEAVLSWVALLSMALAASQIGTSRRSDPMMALVSITFMVVHIRSWLFVTPPPLGSSTEVIRMLMSIPAFVSVGLLAGAWLGPSTRVRAERLPAALLGLAGTIGWWTLLAFGALDPIDRTSFRTAALIICCAAGGCWAIGHLWLWSRRQHRLRSEILIGAGAWAYFAGDICSRFFTDSAIFDGELVMVTARLFICVVLSLAALTTLSEQAGIPFAKGRDRSSFALAILAPGLLSIVPLVAWVSAGEQPPVWFAPAWVGGTLFLVTCMAVAVVAVPRDVRRTGTAMPDLSQCDLHYQPIVRSTDGVTIGAEALFRVNGPDGLRSGGWMFEELAGSRQLPELTNWVMNEAFRDGPKLLRKLDDPEAFISINMSPEEFMAPGLIERIDAGLARAGARADGFMIEITELSFMDGSADVNERVGLLHDRGFLVALDDFGSGYASLHSIVDVDFDLVKIDRSIVVSADKPRGEQVLGRTIELLSASGLLVLAEGVETDLQTQRVLRQKPHFMQGYATGMPMPFEELFDQLV